MRNNESTIYDIYIDKTREDMSSCTGDPLVIESYSANSNDTNGTFFADKLSEGLRMVYVDEVA